MARINFEDDVESQDEFWALLDLTSSGRDPCLGMLVRFFRIAQRAYAYDEPMSEDLLVKKGLKVMIESGWAVRVEGGFQSLGAAKHFDWYRQKVLAGRKGGRPKEDNRSVSAANQTVPTANPPAPAPAPAPTKKKKEEGGMGETASVEASPVSLKIVEKGKEKIDEAVKKILPALIEATGTEFKETGLDLRRGVSQLLKLGYTAEDMVLVTKHRAKEWRHDAKSAAWLKPSTIFRPSKFEEYLPMAKAYFQKVEAIFGAV